MLRIPYSVLDSSLSPPFQLTPIDLIAAVDAEPLFGRLYF